VLYKIEKESTTRKVISKLIEFKQRLDLERENTIPKSVGGMAINYTYNEWDNLVRYIEDGNLNISNAWIENAIRPFCIGRKN